MTRSALIPLTSSTGLAAATVVALILLSGCSDPRFEAKQSVRDERMRYYSRSYLEREEESRSNLKALADEQKALGVRREEQLNDRLRDVKRQEQARVEDLRETRPVRRERVRSIFGGRPDNIRDTWADMIY